MEELSIYNQVMQKVRERDSALQQNFLYVKKYHLKYITANSALNIPHDGVQCDWHQVDMLKFSKYQTHPINYIGAEDIFGNYGLWDCSQWFASKGVEKNSLCATPIRAILDKLFYSLAVLNTYPATFDNFTDLMLDGVDMDELRAKLRILKSHLNEQQQNWLSEWEAKNEI